MSVRSFRRACVRVLSKLFWRRRPRGYDYTVVEDEIVIVEPRTRRVVEVISEPGRGPRMASHASSGQQILTVDQRQSLKQIVHRSSTTGSTASRTARPSRG